jgi:hypothetical protein
MVDPDALRHKRIPLIHGSGALPAVGFGTLIPDPFATNRPAPVEPPAEGNALICCCRPQGDIVIDL